jgi:YVTN family beta-propeller protein
MQTVLIATLGTLLGLGLAGAEPTPNEALLVLSKGDHILAIVDPASLKVIAKVPVGEDPHEVIASTDGKFAYVSNYGGGAYNTLADIDLVAQQALPPIELGALRGPHGLDFTGGKVWFTAEAAKAVGSYDPEAKQIDWIMGTGQDGTHMIAVLQDQKRIVTTNIRSGTVTIMDKVEAAQRAPAAGASSGGSGSSAAARASTGRRPANWEETVLPVGPGAEGFDISPDQKQLWTANAGDGTVSVIDLTQKKVVETLPANVRGANRLKFTPDGKLVLISSLRDARLAVFDGATRKEVKRVKVGSGAAGIQIEPSGARAFVACTPDSYVAVIDLKTLAVSGHLDAGPQPDGMAWMKRP